MEARGAAERLPKGRTLPAWALGLIPLALIVIAVGAFAALDGPGLGERTGPPVEELAIERTILSEGVIELVVRNDGPDAVRIAQVFVNDAFTDFSGAEEKIGRLETERVKIAYPWLEGEAYEIGLLTSTGGTIDHAIPVAVETPDTDISFYGLMALLGLYVGVIPVTLGMLWLPFARRIQERWIRVLMAVTVGLLGFLAIDGTLEGVELAGEGAQSLGGTSLVFLGAVLSYLALTAVTGWLDQRAAGERAAGAGGSRVAFLIALGIGLHNLGEGLAIGSAYATGALALGAFLVVGFALHNTTEGLAIVAPLGSAGARIRLRTLIGLGLLAGAPAILGAWIGASAFNPSLAAFLFGAGVGAIAQVIVQIAPAMRDRGGRLLHPAAAAGVAAGMLALFATGLLVTV